MALSFRETVYVNCEWCIELHISFACLIIPIFQGEYCPEILQRQMQVLENRYGGRYKSHRAATVIQSYWREYILRSKFSRVLNLAKTIENSSFRRRSIFAETDDLHISEVEINVDSGDVVQGQNDLGLSPAARHINNRRRGTVNRSSSLRDHRRSGSWSGFEPIERPGEKPCFCGREEHDNKVEHARSSSGQDLGSSTRPRTAADLQNKMNQSRDETRQFYRPPASPSGSPVPPCPPLRGEDFYPDPEPVYLARDSLYCSVRRPRRLPPRPPQRTVSFLGSEQQTSPESRLITLSDSILPRANPVNPSCESRVVEQNLHLRSISSPAQGVCKAPMRNESSAKCSPLPPPPYIPPPHINNGSEPLPPPPTEMLLPRLPCDSVSSIDSGFRSSCSESTSSTETESVPSTPHQVFTEIPEDPYSYWVSSPTFLTSPESANFYRSTVTPRDVSDFSRSPCNAPNCCCDKSKPKIYETYQDIYGSINNSSHEHLTRGSRAPSDQFYGSRAPVEQNKLKKTVRIQLPASDQENVTEDDETVRRRYYRVGLNLFNTNPDRGINYLSKKDFIELTPPAVAKFLIGRKGLSKKMVGEYICNLQKPFNLAVLHCMIYDMDFSGLHLDIALRQLLSEVHIPGEAQKIEKLVEVFSRRYIECNQMFVSGFNSPDTIFILSYAMVLLNTDLHNNSIKPERKMHQDGFLRNLRGIDNGADVDPDMLRGIYDRIKTTEFKEGPDHVSQVSRVQETITGSKRPKLNTTWRRLVCFCRVAEVGDMHRKEKKDAHQRGIFLFNDLLVVSKTEKSRKKQVHQFRSSVNLAGLRVNMFRTTHHQFGVQLQEKLTGRMAATFSCRSYNDQQRFVGDLQESIAEVEEMERARLFL